VAKLHPDPGSTVEGSRSIDVLRWNRLGYFKYPQSFSWVWKRDGDTTGSIRVRTEQHRVTLVYRSRSYFNDDWEDVSQQVPIEWSPCRFGGARPWFVCSVCRDGIYCGRRVVSLYGAGRLFACRHCYGLAYHSQQESRNQRGLWKAQKIRMRLGGSASTLDEFPPKPKGMHRRTYERLCQVHDDAEVRSTIGLMRYIRQLGGC